MSSGIAKSIDNELLYQLEKPKNASRKTDKALSAFVMLHFSGMRKRKRIFIFEEMRTQSLRVKNVVIMILYPAERVEGKDSSLTITLEHKPHI